MAGKRSGGRPRKKARVRPNSGRKREFNMMTASRTTRFSMAKKIITMVENDEQFLEYTLNLCKKLNRKSKDVNRDEEFSEDMEVDQNKILFKHTNESALALYLETNLNMKTYALLATDCRTKGFNCLPSYPSLQTAMADLLPEQVEYSESEVKVPLQSILNKTAERLCEAVAKDWSCEELHDVELHVTIGFDSSSGHLNPHQIYDDTASINSNPQQSLLVTSCIIQKLVGSNERSWINPTPQSTRFCRPLRICFEKEDNDTITKEYNRLNQEISALKRHRMKTSVGNTVRVKFHVSQTLYDGKCVNTILENTATTKCPICDTSSHRFNDPEEDFEPIEGSLLLGLGLLHCEIKAFEYLLHLGYRLTIKQWDRQQHLLDQVNLQTEKIRQQVNEAFCIRVDQILQGHGTTNTGNLARKCFEDPVKFSEAVEVNVDIVKNIALILRLLRSKQELNYDLFDNLCSRTYEMHYDIYPWARMCPSVHKMLKHSSAIIQSYPLPIAYYAEDASESWHKIYRKNLVCHARQTSRLDRITDTFDRAIYLTDPLISLMYIEHRMKGQYSHPVTTDMREYMMKSEPIEYENTNYIEDENDDFDGSESDSI